jgi:hypothetical protein
VRDISLHDIWLEIRPSVNAGVALCLAALPVYVLTADLNPFFRLLLVGAAASSAYMGALWLFERNTLFKMLEMAGIQRAMRAAGE